MSWVALSKSKHADKALATKRTYLFARKSIIIPIFPFEFQTAVSLIPIFFIRQKKDIVKIVGLFGLEKEHNLFITPAGEWGLRFLPAMLGSYPFRLTEGTENSKTLLIDDASELIVNREDGDPFFYENGDQGEIISKYSKLLSVISHSSSHVEIACSKLEEFNLLENFNQTSIRDAGETSKLNGLLQVNEVAFRNLGEDKLNELYKASALDYIYAHFYSMASLERLRRIMHLKTKAESSLKNLGEKIFDGESAELNFNF
jgi:hypothetical protein